MNFLENTSETKYQHAKEQVEKLKGFYIHAFIYGICSLFFIVLNLYGTSFPWAIFPIAGWGLGLLGHASDVYSVHIFFGKDWERRKIREIMEKDRSF